MKDLTQSNNLHKTFLSFALPLMLAGLLSQSYNIIDTAIVGKWLGDSGLAAVGGTASCITLIASILWGFSAGSSVFSGILFGKKDYERLKSSIITAALLLSSATIVASLLAIAFKDALFDFLKIAPEIREDAFRYFWIYMVGHVFMILSAYGVHIMNALGASSYPLKMSIISTVINLAGNLIAIIVLDWGVAGVAIATILSAVTVDICYFLKLRREFARLGVLDKKTVLSFGDIKTIIKFSIPSSFQQLILYGASFLVTPYINAFGKAITAGYAVISRVLTLATNLYQNSSKSVTNFSSQCIGAKKYHLLRRGVRVGFVQALVFLLPLIVLCSVFARGVCSLFFENGFEGEALDVAVNFVRFWMPLITINAVNNLFHSFWRGIALMKYLVYGTFVGAATQVIATILLAPVGLWGIWLAWAISWAVEAIYNILLYKFTKWDKQFTI